MNQNPATHPAEYWNAGEIGRWSNLATHLSAVALAKAAASAKVEAPAKAEIRNWSQTPSKRFSISIIGASHSPQSPYIVCPQAQYTINGGLPVPQTPQWAINPQSAIRNPQPAIPVGST
jgi:hypothetical protein